MAPNFKQVGVEFVAKNFPSFASTLDKANALAKQASDSISKTFSKNKGFSDTAKIIETFTEKAREMGREILSDIPVVGNFADEILGVVNPTTLAVAAITALTVAAVKLGVEGGKIKGVRQSFDVVTAGIGQTSDILLGRLREAVRGTVNDFDLMRQTNVALAGATGEFGKQFGEALPRILELARVQAQATGQDVGYLVESLITGIKRASPLLIDNTGITLKVGQANEALAQKLGKSVEALTDEEKQIAVLNAVLTSGDAILAQYGNTQELANVKAARTTATIQNMIANIQVALEPFAGAVLNLVNLVVDNVAKVVNGIIAVAQPIINIVSSIINSVVQIIAPIINFIGDAVGGILQRVGSIVETLLAPFQVLIEILGSVGGAIVNFVVTPIKGLLDFLLGVVDWIVGLARGFLKAGATLVGALAAGILKAANAVLLPAVIAIATLIADFLVGHSPPPKGPLSEIDKGGAATMESWLTGFMGVSLDPIDQVTAEVNEKMGAIASYGMSNVKARLKELDTALAPFQNRLMIVRAQFDALKPVTDAAFGSIDRQLDKAVQALASGDQAAMSQVQALDRQREALQGYLDAQQEAIDNAQIQYSLAQAQQAQERALLAIREKQLEVDAETNPVEKEKKQRELDEAKKKAGGGGQAAAPIAGGGGFAGALPGQPSGDGFAGELAGDLQSGFDLGGGQGELAKLSQGGKMIQDQFDRIGKAPLFKSVADGLKGFAELFNPDNPEGAIYQALKFLSDQTNYQNPNGIVGWFHNLPETLRTAVTQLPTVIQESIIKPIQTEFDNFFKGEGKLYEILSAPMTWITDNVVTPLNTKFNEIYTALFDINNAESFAAKAWNFMVGQGEDSLFWILTGPVRWFTANVMNPLNDLFYQLWDVTLNADNQESFAAKVNTFFNGTGSGTLQGALSSVDRFVKDSFANPFIDAINGVIGALEMFINDSVLGALKGLAKTLTDFLASIGDTGSDIVQRLNAFQGSSITIGRIPRLKDGGILGRGIFQAGERGKEIGMSAAPFAMFSNKFVRAIDMFSNIVAQPMPMPVLSGGNNVTNNNQQTMYNTFNGIDKPQEVARRIAMLNAKR